MNATERVYVRIAACLVGAIHDGLRQRVPQHATAIPDELTALDELANTLHLWADGQEIHGDLSAMIQALQPTITTEH